MEVFENQVCDWLVQIWNLSHDENNPRNKLRLDPGEFIKDI